MIKPVDSRLAPTIAVQATTIESLPSPFDHALDKINSLEGQVAQEVEHHHEVLDGEASIVTELTQLVQAEKECRLMCQTLIEKSKQAGSDHAEVDKELDNAEAEVLMIHARVSCYFLPD